MGEIAVPTHFFEDAVDDYDYRNKPLIQALRQASNAVLDILSGQTPHRIWDCFEYWFVKSNASSPDSQVAAATRFLMAFDFPLYPGDVGLIQPFLLRIEDAASKTPGFLHSHKSIASSLASVLFRVVVARFYLGIPPAYDELVFFLGYRGSVEAFKSSLSAIEQEACKGRIVRPPTRHEQAYIASVSGVVDTRQFILSDGFHHGMLTRIARDNISDSTSAFHPILSSSQPFEFPDVEPAHIGLFEPRQDLLPPVPRVLWDPSMIPPGTSRPKARRLGTTPPKVQRNLKSSPLMHIVPSAQAAQNPPPAPPQVSVPPPAKPTPSAPASTPARNLRSRNKRKEPDVTLEMPPVKRIKHKGGYYAIITEPVASDGLGARLDGSGLSGMDQS